MTKTKDVSLAERSISEDEHEQYKRQGGRCLGCMSQLPIEQLYNSNGLLCPHCENTLLLVDENSTTLRRLMAVLEYKSENKRIYLIGTLKNRKIVLLGNKLRDEGFDVMDEWTTPGPEADSFWQKYAKQRKLTYAEALRGRAATNIFLFDRVYIELSDIVVLVMPAGKSAMIELGYAKGIGKKAIIYLNNKEPKRYDIMPAFADKIVKTEKELIAELHK